MSLSDPADFLTSCCPRMHKVLKPGADLVGQAGESELNGRDRIWRTAMALKTGLGCFAFRSKRSI